MHFLDKFCMLKAWDLMQGELLGAVGHCGETQGAQTALCDPGVIPAGHVHRSEVEGSCGSVHEGSLLSAALPTLVCFLVTATLTGVGCYLIGFDLLPWPLPRTLTTSDVSLQSISHPPVFDSPWILGAALFPEVPPRVSVWINSPSISVL